MSDYKYTHKKINLTQQYTHTRTHAHPQALTQNEIHTDIYHKATDQNRVDLVHDIHITKTIMRKISIHRRKQKSVYEKTRQIWES